jgi:Uma2 family endonuclease
MASVLPKVAEYLEAGVVAVVILDDEHRSAQTFRANRETVTLGWEDELAIPHVLPGFSLLVKRFFE